MKQIFFLILLSLFVGVVFSQPIPAYSTPQTVVAQKWYGFGPPNNTPWPAQPGDLYFDTLNGVAYFCSAPLSAMINTYAGGQSPCRNVVNGQWAVFSGGGGMAIGGLVTGGTAGYNLILDGSGNLSQEQYVGAARFPALGGDLTGTNGSLGVQVTATHLASALPIAQGGTGLSTCANGLIFISGGCTVSLLWSSSNKTLNNASQSVTPVVGTSNNNNGFATSVTTNAPASIVAGNAIWAFLTISGNSAGPTPSFPAGFTQVGSTMSSASNQKILGAVACKVATNSEPGSYTASWTGASANFIEFLLVQISGTNCTPTVSVVTGTGTNGVATGVSTTNTSQNSLALIAVAGPTINNGSNIGSLSPFGATTAVHRDTTTIFSYPVGYGVTPSFIGAAGNNDVVAMLIVVPATVATSTSTYILQGDSASLGATTINGTLNATALFATDVAALNGGAFWLNNGTTNNGNIRVLYSNGTNLFLDPDAKFGFVQIGNGIRGALPTLLLGNATLSFISNDSSQDCRFLYGDSGDNIILGDNSQQCNLVKNVYYDVRSTYKHSFRVNGTEYASVSSTGISGVGTNLTGIPLGTAVTGNLAVANGGTGITSGTSGGIPYYSGSTTIASSAALGANSAVFGGGVGAAPFTDSFLTLANAGTANETLTYRNTTASTGYTQFILRSGAVNYEDMLVFQLSNGTTSGKITNTGYNTVTYAGGMFSDDVSAYTVQLGTGVLSVSSSFLTAWNSGNDQSTRDTTLCRLSAGILEIGAATVCATSGFLELTGWATVPVVTSALKTCTATTGTPWRASVSDATAPALGVVLTGGGAIFANVHCSLTTGTYIVDGI